MFNNTTPEFQATLTRLAAVADLTMEEVYTLWQQYSSECQSADQSAVLGEFIEWYRPNLGGNSERLEAALTEPLLPPTPCGAPPATRASAIVALNVLSDFIGRSQRRCLRDIMSGEERQYAYDKLVEMAHIITHMPKTYEQDGKGDDAIVYLHYFKGGCDWHITEKDMGDPEMPGQHQAFGLADLGYGPELGYISIVELLQCGAELDLHFKPRPLSAVRKPETANAD
jgi:hypothetical protein